MSSGFGAIAPTSGFNIFLPAGSNNEGRNGRSTNSFGLKGQLHGGEKFGKQKKQFVKKGAPKNGEISGKMSDKVETRKKVGSLMSDPAALGFSKHNHSARELPKFLVGQQPQLKPRKFVQDPWDIANQKKMSQLEQNIDDLTELYETLKKMRDFERKIMENKGLVDKADSAKDLTDAIMFQGTCQDMCPIFERARRNVEYTVYSYEKNSADDKKANVNKALKVFARPAAAAAPPLPSDVRSPEVLVKTLDYLIEELLPTLPESESFLWDRMRSIRQDFTYQNYSGPEAVDCNERIVRIHLLILHVMVKSKVEFSLQQELEQLHKSLITLSEIYDDVRANGGSSPNEAEFRAYALLSKIRDPDYDKNIQELPKEIFQNELVQISLCFRRLIANSGFSERGFIRTENCMNLYTRIFQLMTSGEVPFLINSFMEIYINEIRFYAFKALSFSLNKKHKPIALAYFKENLHFNDEEEVVNFCEYYSIDVTEEGVDLKTLNHHSHRIPESQPMKQSYMKFVDDQLSQTTYQNLVNSGKPNIDTIPTNPSLNVYNSIEENPKLNSLPLINNSQVENFDILSRRSSASKNQQPIKASNFTQNSSLEKSPTPKVQDAGGFNFKPKKTETLFNLPKPAQANDSQVVQEPKLEVKSSSVSPSKNAFFNEISKPVLPQLSSPIAKAEQKPFQFEPSSTSIEQKPKTLPPLLQTTKEAKEPAFNLFSGLKSTKPKEKTVENSTKKTNERIIEKPISQLNVPRTDINSNIIEHGSLNDTNINFNKNKTQYIDELTENLFAAFIHEKMFIIYNEIKADQLREKSLKKKILKSWLTVCRKRLAQRKRRESRRQELRKVSDMLHVPVSFDNEKSLLSTPRHENLRHSSFLLSTSKPNNLHVSPVNDEVNTFNITSNRENDVWEPLDLNKIYFETIADKSPKNQTIHMDIMLYETTWSGILNKWLKKKFFSDNNMSTKSFNEGNCHFRVNCINDKYNPESFQNLQLLVFNTGVTNSDIFDLELKLKQDGEELIKLVTQISSSTQYCFSILILFWESAETFMDNAKIERLLKLKKITQTFASVLDNVVVTEVAGHLPQESLKQGLSQISKKFQFRHTEKKNYNSLLHSRRSLAGIFPQKQNGDTIDSIDEKMKKMLELELQKHKAQLSDNNTYAHLQNHLYASPKAQKRKLPVLLSEIKNSKFRTPSVPLTDFSSVSTTPKMSSHLAKKARKTQRVVSIPDVILPGTPSHIRNYPSTSIMSSNTPEIVHMNHLLKSVQSRTSSSSSNPTNVIHMAPKPQPKQQKLQTSPPETPSKVSKNLIELKALIDSVNSKINHK